jgi:hypothetical protein
MSNKNIAKLWMNQTKPFAKGSNFFFEGTKIYSYGYHFLIAEIVGDKVIFNTEKYSQSTSKHQSIVKMAISGSGLTLEYK